MNQQYRSGTTYLYVLGDPCRRKWRHGCKVGISTHPYLRMKQLFVGNERKQLLPYGMKLWRLYRFESKDQALQLESALLRYLAEFKAFRGSREWFTCSWAVPEMVIDIMARNLRVDYQICDFLDFDYIDSTYETWLPESLRSPNPFTSRLPLCSEQS